MPGWLNQLAKRCRAADNLSEMVTGQRGLVVLDQRRSPEQCRPLLSLAGKRDFVTLFAGTPLSPLLEAGPWLLDIEVGSEAWHCAENSASNAWDGYASHRQIKTCKALLTTCEPFLYWMTRTAANH